MCARFARPAAVLAALLFGIATLHSCSSSTDPADDDDATPASITDLTVVDFSASAVTLSWTAPGDDDMTGTAARYEVRASDEFIHFDSWPDAVVVPDPPAPQPAGATEHMTIAGLEEEARYFFAVAAFNRAGNWPGPSNCVEVVCFDNTPVVFADPVVEAGVRATLGIPTEPLMRRDARALLALYLPDQGVTDLGGLEECVNLGILDLSDNAISELAPLAGLVAMDGLKLTRNAVVDISPLAGMTRLRHLHMGENAVQDLAPLAALTALEFLDLGQNQITDVSALASMAVVQILRLQHNQITELTPLADLTALQTLVLAYNEPASLEPLSGLVNLTHLDVSHGQAGDLAPLAALTAVQTLIITNIGATSLAPLADMSALRVLLAASNALTDLAPLADKAQLSYLVASSNEITDLQPLVDNPDLGEGDTVVVGNNPLSPEALEVQIPALQARGVAVNF